MLLLVDLRSGYWNRKSEEMTGVPGKNLGDVFVFGVSVYIYRQHKKGKLFSVIFFLLSEVTRTKSINFWIWAILVGYAQIYVGNRYPLDIAGGALLGITIGSALAKFLSIGPM